MACQAYDDLSHSAEQALRAAIEQASRISLYDALQKPNNAFQNLIVHLLFTWLVHIISG